MLSRGIIGGVVEEHQGAVEYEVDLQLFAILHILKHKVLWDSRGENTVKTRSQF